MSSTTTPSTLSKGLVGDVRRAITQMLDKRFLGVLITAIGLTVGLLAALGAILAVLAGFIPASFDLPLIGEVPTPIGIIQGFAVLGTLLASAFLMIPVSAAFANLFVDRIVMAVDNRHYPDRRGTASRKVMEQIGEAARTMFMIVLINLFALILLLFTGPLLPFLFYALNGYILGRETFETVAAHYMPAREARQLRKRNGLTVWIGGILMAIPLTIPIMNLVIPVLGTAAFTHTVQRLRATGA